MFFSEFWTFCFICGLIKIFEGHSEILCILASCLLKAVWQTDAQRPHSRKKRVFFIRFALFCELGPSTISISDPHFFIQRVVLFVSGDDDDDDDDDDGDDDDGDDDDDDDDDDGDHAFLQVAL